MEDIVYNKYLGTMRMLLLQQEQNCGPLKRLLSRDTEEMSLSIDAVTRTITNFLKDNPMFRMYDIKIFVEDANLGTVETIHTLPISAKCYNILLVNTNFSSQNLFKKDKNLGHTVGSWPALSPYLFLQIIWHLKCEDLLVESLLHIPLDLCVQILDIIIKYIDEQVEHGKYINESTFLRDKRLIYLLIETIYNKCLWLHLGILSEQNVNNRIAQLVNYFEMLCDLLISSNFVTTPYDLSDDKYMRRGILVKNMLYYIRKCMHKKIESYSENHNLAKLFTLTYGNFDEHTNYYHMLPANEVKSIVIRFDQKLATLLLNQIRQTDDNEFVFWRNVDDDKNTMESLHHAFVMECHYFIQFMRQNELLVTYEDLFRCLELIRQRFLNPRYFNRPILTLSELCQDIDRGRTNGMRELIKRYKEWDLPILDFINEKIELLRTSDVLVVLEYLHHMFAYLRPKAEKYQLYMSVLRILIRLTVMDMIYIVQNYVERHFDDNPLRCLYNEECFVEFMEGILVDNHKMVFLDTDTETTQKWRIILIFILLHPKEVLRKFVMYEISPEFINSCNMPLLRSFYGLNTGRHNVLLYILKDIVFQQRIEWCTRFTAFLDHAIDHQIISADDIMNEIYITYLAGSSLNTTTVYIMLIHMNKILRKRLCSITTNFTLLIPTLIKTTSLLRRLNAYLPTIYVLIYIIHDIMLYLRTMPIFPQMYNAIDIYNYCGIEPLEMNKLLSRIHSLHIIHQGYGNRCFFVHQRLRTNPQCHPKVRNYVQSFSLDREAFIRHMILHCLPSEYDTYMVELTFIFLHHFGWVDEMMAYENIMRITAEASQIAVMYAKNYPKETFIMCLCALVQFCRRFTKNNTIDKHEAIRHVLLKTLSSMNFVISRTPYGLMYRHLLEHIQDENPHPSIDPTDLRSPTDIYFDQIKDWIYAHLNSFMPRKMSRENNCTCNKRSYCKCHSSHIEKKIATMYNAQLFIRECIKLPARPMSMNSYSNRLLHKLCLED